MNVDEIEWRFFVLNVMRWCLFGWRTQFGEIKTHGVKFTNPLAQMHQGMVFSIKMPISDKILPNFTQLN